ncbi:MAG: geranylgeranyl reductase family protein [Cyclobacteriaceae bacterium]|nr:geranylgeranyl reductase family protein [Cyclobacteriaceae bacterium]
MNSYYDVIIVGGGPGGSACAIELSAIGLSVLVLEKAAYPRDKICGDALSADVINQLQKLKVNLMPPFLNLAEAMPSFGVRFYSPSGEALDVPFTEKKSGHAPGYIITRNDFDAFLASEVKKCKEVEVLENMEVEHIHYHSEGYDIKCKKQIFHSRFLVGADGAHSIVKRHLMPEKLDRKHHCAGVRVYYENISDMHPGQFIELHFYKELMPGYFWIFPLPGNKANVGLGILSDTVSKKKINLSKLFIELIEGHPNLKSRFHKARPLETPKGYGLPLGSKKRKLSGDSFILIGDAAGLIDPFTGEGIGNAIRSGRIAAKWIIKAFEMRKFDAGFIENYDREVYDKMWTELRISRQLQNLLKYPWLFNLVVRKAGKNDALRALLSSMLTELDLKKELIRPSFYLKLLFGNSILARK